MVDDIPPIRMPTRRRRRRPGAVHADKGYDYPRCRAELRRRGITRRIARRRVESSQRLGRHRWRIERTIAWLLGWRRLRLGGFKAGIEGSGIKVVDEQSLAVGVSAVGVGVGRGRTPEDTCA